MSAFSTHLDFRRFQILSLIFHIRTFEGIRARLRDCAMAIKYRVIITDVEPRDIIIALSLLFRKIFAFVNDGRQRKLLRELVSVILAKETLGKQFSVNPHAIVSNS